MSSGRSVDPALVGPIADPALYAGDPFPHYARLRREAPLAWLPDPGCWIATKHADVLRISRDPETFCSSEGILLMDIGRDLPEIPGALLYVDPPEHGRYRRLVNPGFSTSHIRTLEAQIRDRARTLVEAVPLDTTVDVVEALAVPFPLLVIADLLGVPGDDWPRFRVWTDLMIEAAQGTTPESEAALVEMATYFLDLVAERRANPRDDLVSLLCTAEVDGVGLDDGELMMFYGQLLVAGNETTRNLVSGALQVFSEHPDQWARLRSEPATIPAAVEECLRWTTPVISFMRTATRDVEVAGETIRAGEPVLLVYAAANRDEEVFGDTAERFDATRDPNPHVALGFGEHFCLGAVLARLEARVFLEEATRRFATLEPAGPVERLDSGVIAGILRVPVRLGA
ncbi:MAG: cytochrome P450 [Actinomycetes bacterium]